MISWLTENEESLLYVGEGLPEGGILRLLLGGHTPAYAPVYYIHYTSPTGEVKHHVRNKVAASKYKYRTQWTLDFAKENAKKWIEENFGED